MKNVFFLIALTLGISASARTITVTRTANDNAGDHLHQIANVFVDSVSTSLKREFPSAITPGTMSVEMVKNTDGSITLTYSCEIENVTPSEADYYFEHSGALSQSRSKESAFGDANNRANKQFVDRVQKFKQSFGGKINTYGGYISEVTIGSTWWIIAENFVAAGKK